MMRNNRCNLMPNMAIVSILFTLICMFTFSSVAVALEETKTPSLFDAKDESDLQTYIVHLKKPDGVVSAQPQDLESWYKSFLPLSITSSTKKESLLYSYRNVVTGFAAKLTKEEAKEMEKKDGILSARPERILPLQTTHTPAFLGLHQNLGFWKGSNFGKGVIIGVLDTGILPDHPSFSDEGMPPPPTKWKGKCSGAPCNNKLIGAINFVTKTAPPTDDEGHGTHTTSTAGGGFVKGVEVLGNAKGTAAGMAPLAHLAMYKVCSDVGCAESDMLAALDTAVEDGVDVLSLSIGGGSVPFFADSIAVGAFGAMQKGIFVSCSAGNSGPDFGTLSNEAPWILTVGASTVDRSIVATAKLGNGGEYDGESLFQPSDFSTALLPLVYAGMNGNASSALCGPGSLHNIDIKGKVVLCERGGGIGRIAKGQEVKDAGGAAMILMNEEPDGFSTLADAHVLPATHVSYTAGLEIKAYINSTATPMATILFLGTIIGLPSAPLVASFSSRGPSLASTGILKPDIIGPGVSIVAAWPFPLENGTHSNLTYNMISGTSMSCPHLSGIAALLKSSHPDWSPAAIKSAIMTTADVLNLKGSPIADQTLNAADIFATGAGHVNPSKADNPGLIYDIKPDDYIPYLCGLGYSDDDVAVIAHQTVKCAEVSSIPEAQLNYPSFSIILASTPQKYTRVVKNVGPANSSYTVKIVPPKGVSVSVTPGDLVFTETNQEMEYAVTFSLTSSENTTEPFSQGYLAWVSDKYSVRSQISVIFQ